MKLCKIDYNPSSLQHKKNLSYLKSQTLKRSSLEMKYFVPHHFIVTSMDTIRALRYTPINMYQGLGMNINIYQYSYTYLKVMTIT